MKKMIRQRLEELRYEVNSFDKLYGCNLRKPLPIINPKVGYKITISNCELYLIDLLCAINNINPSEYIFITDNGAICTDRFKLDKKFKNLSSLSMNDDFPDKTFTLDFHGRFISHIIYYYLMEIREMVKDIHDMSEEDNASKFDTYIIILNEIVKRLNMLVITYLNNDYSYTHHMKSLIELRLVRDCNPKKEKFIRFYDKEIGYIKECCKTNLLGKLNEDDDIIINDITKLAYMLTTENTKFKHCGTVSEGTSLENKRLLKEILGRLGYAILVNREKCGMNPMFKAFIKSKPEINTNMRDVNQHIELSVALEALEYEKLLIDDANVSRVIDHIIMA